MNEFLCFSRNRCTGVDQLDEHTIRSYCRLQDTLTEAFVEITVRLPDLEIIGIQGDVLRCKEEINSDEIGSLQKVVGVHVGPGMRKIIGGLLGASPWGEKLAFMVEECCHGIILAFTKETMKEAPKDEKAAIEYYAGMVRRNSRVFNRCAAYAPGSALVAGIVPNE